MKILIADDERLVRLSLKHMLEELYPDKYTFIEAKNGQELISLSKLHQPDISFVDINMPRLDGLSALKICKENSPNTEWFILTGEAEFNFAKEAVNLGVRNYLLKPISIEELKTNIEKSELILKNKKIDTNKNFELFIISNINSMQAYGDKNIVDTTFEVPNIEKSELILKNKKIDTNKNFELFIISNINSMQAYGDKNIVDTTFEVPYIYYNAVLFCIDPYPTEKEYDNISKEISIILKNKLNNLLYDDLSFTLFNLNTGDLCLVLGFTKEKDFLFSSIFESLNIDSFKVTPLISKKAKNVVSLSKEINNLKEYCSLRINYKLGYPIHSENLEKLSSEFNNIISFYNDIHLLCRYYLLNDKLKYTELLNKFSINNDYKLLLPLIDINNLNNFLLLNIKFNYTFSNFTELSNCLLKHSNDNTFMNDIKNKDMVDEIMEYVQDNYMNDIGVNTIASIYGITPNYLSKIFHEKSGIKFSDYITTVRIYNGKKMLLENKSLTVKEVSSSVGYFSPRHFTKQFLKIEGYYPSDLIK